jgi:hypothetical protein
VTRSTLVLAVALMCSACASAPIAPPPAPAEPTATFEEKMSWIVRLEDQRMLGDPEPPPPPVKGKPPIVVAPPRPPVPSLVRLLTDKQARIRRRAALAVGRTGLKDGVEPLAALLADEDPEVRQMAAFAIGLIGDVSGKDALVRALTDRSPLVKGTAAEALGLIGDPSAGQRSRRWRARWLPRVRTRTFRATSWMQRVTVRPPRSAWRATRSYD